MSVDVDAIRQALAAVPPKKAKYHIEKNARVWLAQCCDEIERLRAEREAALAEIEELKSKDADLFARLTRGSRREKRVEVIESIRATEGTTDG